MMLLVGIVLLSLAGFLHSFYAANARMRLGTAAGAFIKWRSGIIVTAILILCIALAFIWVGSSIFAVPVALLVYFFVFPLIFVPLLQRVYRPAESGEMSHFDMKQRDAQWAKEAGLDQPKKDCPSQNDFWQQLFLLLTEASEQNLRFVDVEAGELHRRVGWYPGPNHRMPICCGVMRKEMQVGDIILGEPPKGVGASLAIRYHLPRLTT